MWGEIEPPAKTQPSLCDSEDACKPPEEPGTQHREFDFDRPPQTQPPSRRDAEVRPPPPAMLCIRIIQTCARCGLLWLLQQSSLCWSYSSWARLSPPASMTWWRPLPWVGAQWRASRKERLNWPWRSAKRSCCISTGADHWCSWRGTMYVCTARCVEVFVYTHLFLSSHQLKKVFSTLTAWPKYKTGICCIYSPPFLGLPQAPEPISVCPRLLRSTSSALQQSDTETSWGVHQQDQGPKPALRRPQGPAEG